MVRPEEGFPALTILTTDSISHEFAEGSKEADRRVRNAIRLPS